MFTDPAVSAPALRARPEGVSAVVAGAPAPSAPAPNAPSLAPRAPAPSPQDAGVPAPVEGAPPPCCEDPPAEGSPSEGFGTAGVSLRDPLGWPDWRSS